MSEVIELEPLKEDEILDSSNTKWDHVEKWLRKNHPTRLNTVSQRVEYFNDELGKWETMSDYHLNSIIRELRSQFYFKNVFDKESGEMKKAKVSMASSKSKIMEVLESDFNEQVDIFKEYFKELIPDPKNCQYNAVNWKHGHGDVEIKKLANSVVIKNAPVPPGEKNASELWPIYLKKWLVAAVANFFDDFECKNQTMLVLIGGQNDGKTTWLNNLCPAEFNPQYRFCSNLQDPKGKDTMSLLVNMFLVNVDDQLGSINRKDADAIKNLITMPRVTIRLPYNKFADDLPHRASLVGSLNYASFLTDKTGNRRFLPFEIEKVHWNYLDKKDKDAFVNINKVWAEAYWLYLNAEKLEYQYKITSAELEELEKHNSTFKTSSQEQDLVDTHLDIPNSQSENKDIFLMTTQQVESYLTECVPMGLKKPISTEALRTVMVGEGFTYSQRTINHRRPRVWRVLQCTDTNNIYGVTELEIEKKPALAPCIKTKTTLSFNGDMDKLYK